MVDQVQQDSEGEEYELGPGDEEDGGELGEEDGLEGEEEELSDEMLSGEALDEHLDDLEEEEMAREELRMPKDLVGGDDEYDEELDDEGSEEFGERDEEAGDDEDLAADDDDVENEVFAAAREHAEMENSKAPAAFANQEMIDKIEKIEDQMMDEKGWQMQGEIMCKDRENNGLLEEHLDFDTATKLPPQIT